MNENINGMVETINQLEKENENLKFRLSLISGSLPSDFIKMYWSLSDEGYKQLEDAYEVWFKRQ